MASGFKGRMMQDEHTIVVPRHGNVVLLYAPFRHRVVFPTLREVRDECDVRTIRRLREIRHLAATYNNVLLYLCDPLPPREWILRAIRSVLVAMPIVLETPDPDANAWLLEEGLVDCLVPPGTGPLVRRATLLNLFECSAAAEQMPISAAPSSSPASSAVAASSSWRSSSFRRASSASRAACS